MSAHNTMPVIDPIADFITRIRNAQRVLHPKVDMPGSKMKTALAAILKEEGYIEGFTCEAEEGNKSTITVNLKYYNKLPVIDGLKRISKSSRRVYVGADDIPRVRGGMGVVVVSTSQGVMTGQNAQKQRLGGEVLFYVW